jgi:hypothetical protein
MTRRIDIPVESICRIELAGGILESTVKAYGRYQEGLQIVT